MRMYVFRSPASGYNHGGEGLNPVREAMARANRDPGGAVRGRDGGDVRLAERGPCQGAARRYGGGSGLASPRG